MSNFHLAVQFFIQLAVILLFCRLVGVIMELIVINIGLQHEIMSEGLFRHPGDHGSSATLMALPLFECVVGTSTRQLISEPDAEKAIEPKFVR